MGERASIFKQRAQSARDEQGGGGVERQEETEGKKIQSISMEPYPKTRDRQGIDGIQFVSAGH